MSVFEIGQSDEMLSDFLSDSDKEHELGSVFEIGDEFPDEEGNPVAEIGARFRPRFRRGRSRNFFRRGRIRVPANLARRMRAASGAPGMARLPGKPTARDRWVSLGVSNLDLFNGGGAAASITATQSVEPQMTVSPVRVYATAVNNAGQDVSHTVRFTSIKIGGAEQLTAGGAGVPFGLFAQNYQGPNPAVLMTAPAAVKISFTAEATVAAGDTYTVKIGIVCKAQ